MPSIDQDSTTQSSKQDHGHGHDAEPHRYPMATVEFSRVETPFIIGQFLSHFVF